MKPIEGLKLEYVLKKVNTPNKNNKVHPVTNKTMANKIRHVKYPKTK